MFCRKFAMSLIALLLAAPVIEAQTYPSKPVRLINPLGTGGTAEALSRLLSKALSDGLGQPVILESMSGAAGTVGVAYVARAAADGYTLLYGVTGANSIAPSIYAKLPYDPEKDLAPISIAFSGPNVLLVHTSLDINSVSQLLAAAKAKPGAFAFASAGNGSMSHLNGEMLKAQGGIDLLHVPYKGGGAAVPDLLSGRVQAMIETGGGVMQLLKSGKLRALAVTSRQRSALLPEVPTFIEAGLPQLVSTVWGGIFAPAGTPRAALERVAEAAARAAKDSTYREQVAALYNEAVASTPDEFRAFVVAETAKYADVVRRSGMKIE
ncbi:MAG: Bug family tripartite tricarboxylate transporter substrate binding protein [Burkholderiales bacterium]